MSSRARNTPRDGEHPDHTDARGAATGAVAKRSAAGNKGEQTRGLILEHALHLSSEVGLEGLSIGALAKRLQMSKSGLYAHFASKEALQCELLDAAAARFIDVVLTPAIKRPRGEPRLRELFERWLRWERDGLSGGCVFMVAAVEFDDRPGRVRERLVAHVRDMLGAVRRAARIAVEESHFAETTDCEQFAFEFWGVLLAYQHYRRLLGEALAGERARRAFEGLMDKAG